METDQVVGAGAIALAEDTGAGTFSIRAKVDAVTIHINGADELEVIGGGALYTSVLPASGGYDLSYAMTPKGALIVEVTGGGTVTLPTTPADGDWYDIRMINTGATHTISAGTNSIESGGSVKTIGTTGGYVRMLWVNALLTWVMVAPINIT